MSCWEWWMWCCHTSRWVRLGGERIVGEVFVAWSAVVWCGQPAAEGGGGACWLVDERGGCDAALPDDG